MTIPLTRLRDFPSATLQSRQIALVVARHEAQTWPSPEVNVYAEQRALLLHEMVDASDVSVASWGDTDSNYPREVVELIVGLSGPIISVIAQAIVDWLRKRRASEITMPLPGGQHSLLPGIRVQRPDGATLLITVRDGVIDATTERTIVAFLNRAM